MAFIGLGCVFFLSVLGTTVYAWREPLSSLWIGRLGNDFMILKDIPSLDSIFVKYYSCQARAVFQPVNWNQMLQI